MEGLQGSGPGFGVSESLVCGVFSTERSFWPPPGVGVQAGVPPFLNGVLAGRVLSKTSGESGVPKRTLFFFFPAGFTVNIERVNIFFTVTNNGQVISILTDSSWKQSLSKTFVDEYGTIVVQTHNLLLYQKYNWMAIIMCYFLSVIRGFSVPVASEAVQRASKSSFSDTAADRWLFTCGLGVQLCRGRRHVDGGCRLEWWSRCTSAR